MAHKRLLFREEARAKVLRGATALADAVRVTLGPKSRCVLIGTRWGQPRVSDDGVTIAKEVELPDPEEDLGARMLREAASRTGDAVGDGTTTATLLAHAIFADGLRNVAAGASAVDLKRGLDRGARAAVAALAALSQPVRTHAQQVQVATIAAHGDVAMGQRVADAVERVGPEGVITVEEAKGTETSVDVVEGMRFDRGYLSPYFVTDAERMECVLEDALVFLTDQKVRAAKELLPLLEHVARSGRPLLVVADDVEGDALATLVVNRVRGVLPCAAVKAPGFGDRRKALLDDLAALTGAEALTADLGAELERVKPESLGRAARVVVAREHTTVVGGQGDRKAIDARIEQVRRQIKETTSDYDREKLQERLAKLAGGVAVVRVGAPTEAEMKKQKEAFEDAINAARAAAAEGLVPGAGLALLRVIDAVTREEAAAEGDERTGLGILKRALEVPTRQIAKNSGLDDGVVVEKMRAGVGAFGLDAATRTYVDLVAAGIVDATKVVRMALEHAVSVASVLLLAEATLTELPEPDKAAAREPALE